MYAYILLYLMLAGCAWRWRCLYHSGAHKHAQTHRARTVAYRQNYARWRVSVCERWLFEALADSERILFTNPLLGPPSPRDAVKEKGQKSKTIKCDSFAIVQVLNKYNIYRFAKAREGKPYTRPCLKFITSWQCFVSGELDRPPVGHGDWRRKIIYRHTQKCSRLIKSRVLLTLNCYIQLSICKRSLSINLLCCS